MILKRIFFPHFSEAYGLSPVCILKCLSRLAWQDCSLPQIGHLLILLMASLVRVIPFSFHKEGCSKSPTSGTKEQDKISKMINQIIKVN